MTIYLMMYNYIPVLTKGLAILERLAQQPTTYSYGPTG
jgi:hypothetical protein